LVELHSLFWAWLPAKQVQTDRELKTGTAIMVKIATHDEVKHRLYVDLLNDVGTADSLVDSEPPTTFQTPDEDEDYAY
jgi:hypothetical protein